jgi:membrane-associated phospholipid phosphatase
MKILKRLNSFIFWQPSRDWFKKISEIKNGSYCLLFFNYIIWVYFFYISFKLVSYDTNIFWQLFLATVLSEFIEKYLKIQSFWKRPVHNRNNIIPKGLIKSWYHKGSFPSGHAIKTIFFLLFILQYQIVSPIQFLLITAPLLFFRLIVGFHYPIDIIGGTLIGCLIWLFTHQVVAPDSWTEIIRLIFNTIFQIN